MRDSSTLSRGVFSLREDVKAEPEHARKLLQDILRKIDTKFDPSKNLEHQKFPIHKSALSCPALQSLESVNCSFST